MGELADSFKRSLKPLDDLHERLRVWEKGNQEREKQENISELMCVGLREYEAKAWLKNEPDFTKRIAKPIDRKRRGHVMLAILLLVLATPNAVLHTETSLPNSLPRLPAPNDNDALPLFW